MSKRYIVCTTGVKNIANKRSRFIMSVMECNVRFCINDYFEDYQKQTFNVKFLKSF